MKKQRFTMFVIVTFTLVSCQLFGTKRVDEIEKVTTEAKSMMDNQTPKMIVTNKHLAVGDSILSSRWDRYLGMTAPMTQVPVPTAIIGLPIGSTKNLHDLRRYNNLRNVKMQY